MSWTPRIDNRRIVAGLLNSLRRRGLDESFFVDATTDATFGLASPRSERNGIVDGAPTCGPILASQRGLMAVLDARIDNRQELEVSLNCPSDATDAELVLAGYERWGPAVADALCGDFALVIWDMRRRTLYAARDPFGVKTLYFCATDGRLLLSNDVEPLVAHVDRRDIDTQMVLDYLTTSFGHYRKTFYRGIARLEPGHYLLATDASVRQVRYFYPPQNEIRLATTEDYQQEFRRLLTQSVRDRVRSSHPVVAHLSGGLDSTSIVLLADEIYSQGATGLPPLRLASAVFPGLDCDESVAIAATAARVAFPAERWIGYDAEWEHLDHPTVAWPGSPAPISGGSAGDLRIARKIGARVILAGTGGDEVSHGGGVFRDIAAAGRWLTLLREALGPSRFRWRYGFTHLLDSMVTLVPEPLRRLRHQLTPTRAGDPPAWLGPRLRELWPGDEDDWDIPGFRWRSWLQMRIWRSLATATMAIPMDYRHHYGAEAGVELRFPFLDRRLVSFVLAIPWEHRLPGGYMRRLQWKALEARIPPEVFVRPSVVTSESARIHEGKAGMERYRALFEGERWEAKEFVSQVAAKRLLTDAMEGSSGTVSSPFRPDSRRWQAVQRVATLETWLRAVFRYIAPTEG